MARPTIEQLKLHNPDFFHPMWSRVFGSRADILPRTDKKGEYELIIDSRFARPVYHIDPETFELTFSRMEE